MGRAIASIFKNNPFTCWMTVMLLFMSSIVLIPLIIQAHNLDLKSQEYLNSDVPPTGQVISIKTNEYLAKEKEIITKRIINTAPEMMLKINDINGTKTPSEHTQEWGNYLKTIDKALGEIATLDPKEVATAERKKDTIEKLKEFRRACFNIGTKHFFGDKEKQKEYYKRTLHALKEQAGNK